MENAAQDSDTDEGRAERERERAGHQMPAKSLGMSTTSARAWDLSFPLVQPPPAPPPLIFSLESLIQIFFSARSVYI